MSDKGKILTLEPRETVDAEAAAWLARLDRGDLADSERLELRQWLAEDERHAAALQSSIAFWEDVDELARDMWAERATAGRRGRSRRSFAFGPLTVGLSAMAALVVAVVVLVGDSEPPVDRAIADFELAVTTGLGEYRTIALPDTSEASLNSDTLVEIEYTAEERRVRLLRGEARFDVAHDPERPFAVLANGRVIEAVGTAFVVKIDGDETLVSVTEGQVRVASADEVSPTGDPFEVVGTSGAGRRLLHSGEELVFAAAQMEVEVRQYDPLVFERRLAWTEGRMVFAGESLRDVIAEFGRHSNIAIELSEPSVADLEVTGNFILGDVDAFLEAIEISLGVRAERLPGDRVLLAPAAELRDTSTGAVVEL